MDECVSGKKELDPHEVVPIRGRGGFEKEATSLNRRGRNSGRQELSMAKKSSCVRVTGSWFHLVDRGGDFCPLLLAVMVVTMMMRFLNREEAKGLH
jgi:hypothetical protein